MSLILTKNNFSQLNCFFTKRGLENISRPTISYIKVDSSTRIQPVFHIGFKENMGFLDSFKINGGAMIFEVLEGYPLQDLLFKNNKSHDDFKKMKFRLEDLEPMDFYCIQNRNKDIFGDFVLKNLKFINTKMDQGTSNFGRKIIAEFICSEMIPFQIPFFYNKFISDNYEYHIIRDKKEIEYIKEDLMSMSGQIPKNVFEKCIKALNIKTNYKNENNEIIDSITILIDGLEQKFQEYLYDYLILKPVTENSAIIRIQLFIKEFYTFKNRICEEEARKDHRLMLTNYLNLGGQ